MISWLASGTSPWTTSTGRLALQNGDDFKTMQENLGHAIASFTLDVYGHVSARMKTESASRMEGYIQSLSDK